MKRLFLACTVVLLSACTDSSGAYKALEGAGYKNIQTQGYAWFSCGKDDTYATKFEATGPTGVKVKGEVCKGFLFKGSTIRTE